MNIHFAERYKQVYTAAQLQWEDFLVPKIE